MSKADLDNIASRYHVSDSVPDKFIEDISQYYFCDWLKREFNPSLKVCEMGFGEGITASQLSAHFPDYTVVEGSDVICDQAKGIAPEVAIVNALFEDYQPTGRYDLILALHVIEHVDEPLVILNQVRNWLAPGGTLLVLVPNKTSLHRQFALNMGLISSLDELSPRDHVVGHQRVYDFELMENDLVESGFKVIGKKGFFLKTVPNSMMLEYSEDLVWQLNYISEKLDPSLLANICAICQVDN